MVLYKKDHQERNTDVIKEGYNIIPIIKYCLRIHLIIKFCLYWAYTSNYDQKCGQGSYFTTVCLLFKMCFFY